MSKNLRMPRVCEMTGCSPPTIKRLVAAGLFPQPIYVTANIRAWPEDEVEAWNATRRAARDAGRPAEGAVTTRAAPLLRAGR